ncbi:MAG: hypothetical protein IPP17_30810 [Bacteroidetes bacterium]|nr:hypothetical protein [Bacteroidota bacterium]
MQRDGTAAVGKALSDQEYMHLVSAFNAAIDNKVTANSATTVQARF